jgi:hypothetical protein
VFALLMYENYIGKWNRQDNIKDNEDKQREEDEDEQHDRDKEHEEGEEAAQSVPGERKSPTKAVKGKYTVRNNGTTKYGGWSDKGMTCYNELYKLVKEDRKYPQAVAMEMEFLEYARYYACHSKQRSTANNAGTAIGELANVQQGIVQSAWESDDE